MNKNTSKSLSIKSSQKNNSDFNTNANASQYMMSSKRKGQIEVILDVYKLRGFWWSTKYFLISIASVLFSPLWSFYYKLDYDPNTLSNDIFIFDSLNYKKLPYFYHTYNVTWSNERRIEFPLIKYYMTGIESSKILELGNVLSHYVKTKHDIVDEYEYDPGIMNVDIMIYNPKKKYDLILSISTLEHVGVDGEKEPGKALKTIRHLKTLLSQNGKIIFTIPIGYNKLLDKAIKNDPSFVSKAYYFKRVTSNNKWVEIDKKTAFTASYGFPYRWGNSIVLGIVKK